jgi:hypothetical protein
MLIEYQDDKQPDGGKPTQLEAYIHRLEEAARHKKREARNLRIVARTVRYPVFFGGWLYFAAAGVGGLLQGAKADPLIGGFVTRLADALPILTHVGFPMSLTLASQSNNFFIWTGLFFSFAFSTRIFADRAKKASIDLDTSAQKLVDRVERLRDDQWRTPPGGSSTAGQSPNVRPADLNTGIPPEKTHWSGCSP